MTGLLGCNVSVYWVDLDENSVVSYESLVFIDLLALGLASIRRSLFQTDSKDNSPPVNFFFAGVCNVPGQ